MIPDEINNSKFGAQILNLTKNDLIFREGDKSQYIFWLLKGEIHMYNSGAEGKEFLQMKVQEGQCFGEAAFILDLPYPISAMVMSQNCELVRQKRENFEKMIRLHPEIMMNFTQEVAKKVYEKTVKLKELVYGNPEEKLMAVLEHFKVENGNTNKEVLVPFTRRELANTTGLCVETVIRTVKKLEKKQKLKIINRKIHI